jgi:hypothetical protein
LCGSGTAQVLTQDEIDEKLWKYISYEGCTNFVASENGFFALWRFSSVNITIELSLYDEIVILEAQLTGLGIKYYSRYAPDVNNGNFRYDEDDRGHVI